MGGVPSTVGVRPARRQSQIHQRRLANLEIQFCQLFVNATDHEFANSKVMINTNNYHQCAFGYNWVDLKLYCSCIAERQHILTIQWADYEIKECTTHTHKHTQPLPKDDTSWQLYCQKTTHFDDTVGRKMSKECTTHTAHAQEDTSWQYTVCRK